MLTIIMVQSQSNRKLWALNRLLNPRHDEQIKIQKNLTILTKTRKLCYRKDNSAMRPIYGCSENFREFLTTPTVTIPEIFNGLFSRSILWMFV